MLKYKIPQIVTLTRFLFKGVIIYSIYSLESAVFFLNFTHCKYIQWRR